MKTKGQLVFENPTAAWPAERAAKEEEGEEGGQTAKEEGGEGQEGGQENEGQQLVDKLVEKLKPPEKSEEQKINELVKKSAKVLLKISSHSFLDFFPDELTVDETKITIVVRNFFGSGQIYSIPFKQLQDTSVEMTPFSATLKIVDKRYKNQPIVLKHLKVKEAIEAHHLIEGLILSTEQKIDVGKINAKKAAEKVEGVGKTPEVEQA